MKKIIILIAIFIGINLYAKDLIKSYNLIYNSGKKTELRTTESGIFLPIYKGKVVLLAFFGKNCPPCMAEIPGFIKLQNKLSKNLQIVGVHVQQKMTKAELSSFVTMRNINYPIIPASSEVLDIVNFVASKTGWKEQIPFSLLIDKNGNVKKTYLGMQSEERLTKDIKALY